MLRGVGFTLAFLVGLWIALYVVVVLFFLRGNDHFDTSAFNRSAFQPNWPGIVPVAIVVVASCVLWRRARTWSERPRWLIPCAAAVVAASLVIAFWPFRATDYFADPTTCAAIADAWHPVVSEPSAADLAVWKSKFALPALVQAPSALEPAQRRSFYAHELQTRRDLVARVEATPAFQRADRYIYSTYTRGVCVSTARPLLAASGGVLLLGTAVLGVAVTRRRRAYLRSAAE